MSPVIYTVNEGNLIYKTSHIPVAARSKTWICDRSLTEIAVRVVCCQVEVFTAGRSLARGSPTDCGASECDLGTSTMWSPGPTGGAVEP